MLTNVPNERFDFNFILVSIYTVRYCSIENKEKTRLLGEHLNAITVYHFVRQRCSYLDVS